MLLSQRALTAWVVINLVASAMFTYFASWTWLEPNLRREEVASGGDVMVWAMGCRAACKRDPLSGVIGA
jgi:hypothetical protein